MFALAAVSTGAKLFSLWGAAEAEEDALEMKRLQAEVRAEQEGIARAEKMRRILGQQIVTASAEGVTEGSFAAINRASWEQFAEDKRIADINLMMQEESIDISEENIKQQAMLQTIGTVAQAGANIYSGSGSSADFLSNVLGL